MFGDNATLVPTVWGESGFSMGNFSGVDAAKFKKIKLNTIEFVAAYLPNNHF